MKWPEIFEKFIKPLSAVFLRFKGNNCCLLTQTRIIYNKIRWVLSWLLITVSIWPQLDSTHANEITLRIHLLTFKIWSKNWYTIYPQSKMSMSLALLSRLQLGRRQGWIRPSILWLFRLWLSESNPGMGKEPDSFSYWFWFKHNLTKGTDDGSDPLLEYDFVL